MKKTNDDTISRIINSFKNKKIIIVLISRCKKCGNYNIDFSTPKNTNMEYIQYTLFYYESKLDLLYEEIQNIFQSIKDKIKQFKEKTLLLIFNEFFFSFKPLTVNDRNNIIKLLFKIFVDFDSILFLVNFLHELDSPLCQNEINLLKKYLEPIDNFSNVFGINPNKGREDLINNASKKWYSNESLLLFNNKIIFSYKKQTYHKEMHLDGNNFSLGFGQKETKLNPEEYEYKL